MAVYLNSKTITNEIDSTSVNFLLANVGDKIVIEYDISVKEYVLSSTSSEWIVNNNDGYVIIGSTAWITGGDFSKFNVGDLIQMNNYVSVGAIHNVTIVEKLSDTEIRISANPFGWGINRPETQLAISLVMPITALSYNWNFIENDEATNFFSKIDNTIHLANISGLNASLARTNLPMSFVGTPPSQIGSIVVDEVSLVTSPIYTSNFKIRHTTYVTPFILASQWDDLQAGIAPTYLFNTSSLKDIANIEARYNLTDPNKTQKLLKDDVLGNAGWFGENFNTASTKYSVNSLSYVDTLTSDVLPKCRLNVDNIDFSFTIRNTIDTPFVAGSTKLIINFAKVPNDEAEYTLNTRDLRHNFVWEQAELRVDSIPIAVDGNNYADTTLRSLATLKATFVNSSTVNVTGKFKFHADSIAVFEESDEPRYIFWIAIKKHSLNGTVSDRANILIDSANFYYKTEFPDLITFSTKLVPHDAPDYYSTYIDARDKFAEDELVAYNVCDVGSDPLVTSIELLRATHKLWAVQRITGEKFILESKTVLLPPTPVYLGYQQFNIVTNKPIRVPSTEIRKSIVSRNRTGVVETNLYEFAYPFLVRWEYWEALLYGHSDFFDVTEPNNGINHDWYRYHDNNWLLEYELELSTKINGVPALYNTTKRFFALNRNEASENTTCQILTQDKDTLALLTDGTDYYILGYKDTLVAAIFENTVDTFDPATTVVVIGLEVFEEGGVNGKGRMSSKYASDSDTYFVPLPAETKTKLTFFASNTICKAEALIDFTTLNLGKSKWKLTARIYGNNASITHGDVFYGQNYLGSTVVKLIPTDPIPTTPTVITPVEMDCCSDYVWRVLADVDSTDELKNDKTSFIWFFNKDVIDTAILKLVLPDNSEIDLTSETSFGTPYNYGFKTNGYNENAVGYLVEWNKIIDSLGEGVYYVKCYTTTIFGGSYTQTSKSFCLKQYTEARANGTVRIEYNISGLIGNNQFDDKLRDFTDLNWYNQHRFDGVFRYTNSAYTEDNIQYDNGQLVTVEHSQDAEYILELKNIPAFKHDILRTDIIMSNEKYITDYNNKNFDNYYKKRVKNNGNYEPKFYPLKSKLAPINLKFKQEFSNLAKFRS
jgi:hypothetical protein